jgi:hypothetical protein
MFVLQLQASPNKRQAERDRDRVLCFFRGSIERMFGQIVKLFPTSKSPRDVDHNMQPLITYFIYCLYNFVRSYRLYS